MKSFYITEAIQTKPPSNAEKPVPPLIDSGWMPLFQTIAWIIFWGVLISVFNHYFKSLLNALVSRIQQGSPFEAGTLFKLGAPPEFISKEVQTATSEGANGINISENEEEGVLKYWKHSSPIVENIYLVHTAEVVTPRGHKPKSGEYRVRVWLESDQVSDFKKCQRVIYRLHETFKPQVIATQAKDKQFELWLNVWGEFTVIAYVERDDGNNLWLTRYLDLPGRPK